MPSFYRVPGRASFSEFTRASSLKLVRTAATARELSRSRTACGGKYLTSCLTRMGGPEIDCTHAWHTATRPQGERITYLHNKPCEQAMH